MLEGGREGEGDEGERGGKRMRRREGDVEGGGGEGKREGKERKTEDEGKMEEDRDKERGEGGEGKESKVLKTDTHIQ